MEQVSEIKYLGIYFDSRFSFDRHIDYITGERTPVTNMLGKSAKLKYTMVQLNQYRHMWHLYGRKS